MYDSVPTELDNAANLLYLLLIRLFLLSQINQVSVS
jgi:hypothetical protein